MHCSTFKNWKWPTLSPGARPTLEAVQFPPIQREKDLLYPSITCYQHCSREAFISLLGEHAEVGLALAVEGYETMRTEYDRVKRQLDDVRKTVMSQCEARKQVADQEVVASPFYGGFSGRGRGYRGR